jgi:ribosomal protein S21
MSQDIRRDCPAVKVYGANLDFAIKSLGQKMRNGNVFKILKTRQIAPSVQSRRKLKKQLSNRRKARLNRKGDDD